MKKDPWIRTVTVTRDDLRAGDWQTRDRNPLALAMRRVLKPDIVLYVDLGPEEFCVAWQTHREWRLLPAEARTFATRVADGEAEEELTLAIRFPPWSLA